MKTHFFTGCSLGRHRGWGSRGGPVTNELNHVSCLACLNIIKKKGLRPRSDFPDVPTFDAEPWSHGLAFTCPCCGERNVHGQGDGHRVSHCECWKRGYDIRCRH